jgi:hypothetical protein
VALALSRDLPSPTPIDMSMIWFIVSRSEVLEDG